MRQILNDSRASRSPRCWWRALSQKPADQAAPSPKAGGQRTRQAKSAVAAPKIEVAPETKDDGHRRPRVRSSRPTFLVKNTGGSDLVISDARPGCGCTVASFDKVIKPGAEGKVHHLRRHQVLLGPDLQVGAARLERPRARRRSTCSSRRSSSRSSTSSRSRTSASRSSRAIPTSQRRHPPLGGEDASSRPSRNPRSPT